MREADLNELLQAVRAGQVTAEEALARLRELPFADLGVARVDHHRQLRLGFPEVILCQGKTTAQCVEIVTRLREISGIAGIHVIGMGREEVVRHVIEWAGLLPRPMVQAT